MRTDQIQSNAVLPPVASPLSPSPTTRQVEEKSASEVSFDKRQENEPSLSDVQDATERVSNFVGTIRSELNFSVDQASGVGVVKVIDTNTKEVIRQIPSREIIQLAQALDKLQGLFVRDKA